MTYDAPLLTRNGHLSMLFGQILGSEFPKIQKDHYERYEDKCDTRGSVTFDIKRCEPSKQKNRVIVILPGVTGCSSDRYVQEMVHKGLENGYCAIVVNHLVPKHEDT